MLHNGTKNPAFSALLIPKPPLPKKLKPVNHIFMIPHSHIQKGETKENYSRHYYTGSKVGEEELNFIMTS